ncbi:Myb/SANT-like DNA-binding domain [Popillia japonica]|uniref:Regulatory protein zeste n=1 Tax=Popillia japonica TaxID=7064 RepID=A0AAW1HSH5_POPJA
MDEINRRKHQYCNQQQKDELVYLVREEPDLLIGKLTNTFTYKDSERKWIEIEREEPDLLIGKLTNTFTYKDSERKWIEIESKLNAIPGGQKNWKQWRKTWQDMKSRTKLKGAAISRYAKGTGGGPPIKQITRVDENILNVTNPTSVTGDSSVAEAEIEFIFEDEEVQPLPMQVSPHTSSYIAPEILESTAEVEEEETVEVADTPRRKLPPKRGRSTSIRMTSAKASAFLANLSAERLAFEKEKFEFEKSCRLQKLAIIERQAKAIENLVKTKQIFNSF